MADTTLERGLEHHQRGQFREAEAAYMQVLARVPAHPQALYYLGTLAGQMAQWDRAVDLLRQAVALNPDQPDLYNNLGIALKGSGAYEDAIAIYREALRRRVNYPEALSNLGNLLAATGRVEEAVECCRRALALRPDYLEARFNLGVALEAAGQRTEAVAAYRQVAQYRPNFAEVIFRLGRALVANGEREEGVARLREAVRLKPALAEAHMYLAMALDAGGQFEEAIASYRQVLWLQPTSPEARNNLGAALEALGKLDEAAAEYRQAIISEADFAEAHYNLGSVLVKMGKEEEAMASLSRAVAVRPTYAEAHNNLGALLRNAGRYQEAIEHFEMALQNKTGYVAAMNNMGVALHALNRFQEAAAIYREALLLDPAHTELLSNLGAALNMLGDIDEALAVTTRAIESAPRHVGALNNLATSWKQQGELDKAIAAYREAMRLKPDDPVAHSNLVYLLHFHPDMDAPALLAEHRTWDRVHGEPLRATILPHDNSREPQRRLRIGYVSPDFREHVIARFMAPLFEAHDPQAVEVYCYSDVLLEDAMTARLRASANHWRTIRGLSDARVAEIVREDRIDILVDLTMHMSGTRMKMFARKPAPVQTTYLAYCSTTGLSTMDYRLSDPHFDPPGIDLVACYVEKTVRLPRSYWCYEAPVGAPEVNDLPAEQVGYVTFGCLNNFTKASAGTFATWRELLVRMPTARLILHAQPGSHRDRVAQFFEAGGVARDRVEFVGLAPMAEYLRLYQRMDVMLDPFPYAGGTTSCDGLWMGVPLVTLQGRTGVGRGGVSLLNNLGLAELIAEGAGDYIRIAAALAEDVGRLRNLRRTLRERMRASPLMQPQPFARAIEDAYRQIWQTQISSPDF